MTWILGSAWPPNPDRLLSSRSKATWLDVTFRSSRFCVPPDRHPPHTGRNRAAKERDLRRWTGRIFCVTIIVDFWAICIIYKPMRLPALQSGHSFVLKPWPLSYSDRKFLRIFWSTKVQKDSLPRSTAWESKRPPRRNPIMPQPPNIELQPLFSSLTKIWLPTLTSNQAFSSFPKLSAKVRLI